MKKAQFVAVLRNEALITSETFKANLAWQVLKTGFKNLSGLVPGILKFSFLSIPT
jgi:hypothetical protein